MTDGRGFLDGRPVIVTGAARGIGAAIARSMARLGARVGVVDRSARLTDLADELGAEHAVVDLADVGSTRAALDDLIDRLEGCWCLVNNAGVFAKQPLLEIDPDEWDAMQAINVRSMLVTIQAVAPSMIDCGGGRIVNMASMAAKLGTAGEAAYAASKAAVVALTRIAAMELGRHDITVNAICPGYVLTDMGAGQRTDEQVARWSAQSPLGRLATTDDVVALIAHLVGEHGGYLTGDTHNVTGGMCTW